MASTLATSDKLADLAKISANDLLNGTVDDARLFQACKDNGFFYLDYRDSPAAKARDLFSVTEAIMSLPDGEKIKYDNMSRGPERMDGYRLAGISNGPVGGKSDGFESYSVPNNSLFGFDPNRPFTHCAPVLESRKLLQEAIGSLNEVGLRILASLSRSLKLPDGQKLEDFHRPGQLTTSTTSLLQYLPDSPDNDKVGHYAHTDIGTLSFVFTEVPGLQVLLPGSEEWQFVRPLPGHAVVNVADCLTFLSHQQLPSILHRVIPDPRDTRIKRTTGYFMRPEFEAPLTDREGKTWRNWDWHTNKFVMFRASKDEQVKNSYVTGRHGFLGLVDGTKA